MEFIVATKAGSILGPLASLFGYIMEALYRFTGHFGIYNLGICIILFTIITKLILFPLTIKQQESSRLMNLMNPEIKKVQKKYKGKTDQTSMAKQQAEMQEIYNKYGYSMTSGCLPLLIQLPIIFALYRVIYNIPAYVPSVKALYQTVSTAIGGNGAAQALSDFANANNLSGALKLVNNFGLDKPGAYDAGQISNYIIDFLYKLTSGQWAALQNVFPQAFQQPAVLEAVSQIERMNTFLGINLAMRPWQGFDQINWAWLLPILSGLTQFFSTKLMSTGNSTGDDSPMAQQMKSMTYTMPLVSVFFCFTLPAAIGIYWVIQGVVTLLQQVAVNHYMDHIDINQLIEKNVAKMNKKRARKGLPPAKVTDNAQASLRSIEVSREKEESEEKSRELREEATRKIVKDSTEYYNQDAKPGSLAAKAGMVKKYNEKHKTE